MNRLLYKVHLLFLLLLIACSSRVKQSASSVVAKSKTPNLIGKHILSIDSVVSEKHDNQQVLYLFNHYDCGSCIDSGFQITKIIDKLCGRKTVVVIATMTDPSYYQGANDYFEYIYVDNRDFIRKELKYIQTPVLLLLNNRKEITGSVYPNVTSYEDCQRFIDSVSLSNN